MSSRTKQALPHFGRKATVEDNVPKRIGDSVTATHSLGAMVIKVVLLDVAEVTILEVIVVLAVMNPLFKHITQHNAAQENRGRIDREKNETNYYRR